MSGAGQAGMRAQTDQAIAAVRHNRQSPCDELARAAITVAADLASGLADEFGDDAEIAGRALVSAAFKVGGLAVMLHSRTTGSPAEERNIQAVMVYALAFAGEEMARKGGERP